MIVTLEEINQFRALFADDPDAMRSLDMIEDCEGDLEDAAIALALRVGQEPSESERWLEGVAKRWRAFMCEADFRANLQANSAESLVAAVRSLTQETDLPPGLATPIVIYVLKTGIDNFCKPLEEKL